MKRRKFIRQAAFTTTGIYLSKYASGFSADFPVVRMNASQRKFKSPAVEHAIETIKTKIGNLKKGSA